MDPLSTLEGLTEQVAQAKQTHAFGSSINAALAAATQAKPTLNKLERMSGFVPLVGYVLNNDERQSLKLTLKDLKELGGILEKTNDLAGVQESARILTHDLGRDVTSVETVVNAGWKKVIEREFGVTGRLGRVLSQLPETNALGNKMLALYKKASTLAADLDSATKQDKELKQLSEAREKLNDELKDLGTADEVIAFLLAVANQTATVGELTGKVRIWLAERQALKLFRISL